MYWLSIESQKAMPLQIMPCTDIDMPKVLILWLPCKMNDRRRSWYKSHCYKIFVEYSALISRDVAFCDNMYGYIQNLLKKSTLISAVSERERNYFFKSIRQKIQSRKQKLKV